MRALAPCMARCASRVRIAAARRPVVVNAAISTGECYQHGGMLIPINAEPRFEVPRPTTVITVSHPHSFARCAGTAGVVRSFIQAFIWPCLAGSRCTAVAVQPQQLTPALPANRALAALLASAVNFVVPWTPPCSAPMLSMAIAHSMHGDGCMLEITT